MTTVADKNETGVPQRNLVVGDTCLIYVQKEYELAHLNFFFIHNREFSKLLESA